MAMQRTYGSAMSALETTYINLCVEHKAYGYIDDLIDTACMKGDTFILVNMTNIPAESEEFSIKNRDFLTKMLSILFSLGFQVEVKDEIYIFISWLDPYFNLRPSIKESED